MLRFLSARKSSQKLVWIILSAIMIFGMVAFYSTPSRQFGMRTASGAPSPVNEDALIAQVGPQQITAKDYINGLDNMIQAYQGILSSRGGGKQDMDYNSLKGMGLDKSLLDSLIRKKLVQMEVKRLNLLPTDEEVRDRIREQFSPDGKWVGYEKYQKFVERSGQTVESYEEALRDQIAEDKLRTFVSSAIQVSPQEVQEQFNRENTNFNLAYTVVDPSTLADKVTVNDADLRSYFDAHKADFHVDKPSRKVDYIFVAQDAVGKTLQISDDELKKDYDPEKFVDGVRVSQIMLKSLSPKDDPTVQNTANGLVVRARGANGTQPEDFAALARGNSQDAATKGKDGDLGFVKKEDIKPGSYLQRALAMKVNDISDPIKEGSNFYILKVTERKNKTFEEAKETLLATARNRNSYKRASEIAEDAAKQLKDKKDLNAVAADVAQKLGQKPEDVLRHTPLFADGDDVPEIGTNPSFEETTAALKNPGDVGPKVGVRGGFAVAKLVEKRDKFDPTFDEAKTKIEQRYKQDKAKDLAAEKAKAVIAAAGAPDALKAAAEKEGLKYNSREGFREGQSLDEFGGLAQIMTTALTMKEGQVVKEPVFGNEKYLVFGITKRTDPDLTKFNEQSKTIEQRLLEDRRSMTFDSYIDAMKKKLKQDGQLKIYKETIDQIFAKSTPNPVGLDQ